MSAPAPVIDWADVGMTPAAISANIGANASQYFVVAIGFVGLALTLRYGKKIKNAVKGL